MGQKLKQIENHIKGTDAVHRSICHFTSTVPNGEICLGKMTRKSTADLMKTTLQQYCGTEARRTQEIDHMIM